MSNNTQIEQLFGELIELETTLQRDEFLENVGRDDPGLRDQLRNLLAAHEGAGSFLNESDGVDETVDSPSRDLAGTTIGSYKLREVIGEGGMGTVYVAEQEKPLRRKVALKVVKAGMDSNGMVARFEAERQALALMNHPNIAKVFDAGTTTSGQPFFVMELVKGVPITEYCDANRLSTDERLRLMIDVCNAVQHAHQKGVIHRDLKPSNILVAQYDDRPVPKVIDFGVAKATHQKLTEKTIYTQLGQIVGTLEYMSPEQAVMNELDVDTRTDVYSLGVMLYELLVGETPLDGKELRAQALDQILLAIRELEPARPSIRLSSQGQAATQTAAYRKTNQSSLSRVLKGDLDWVVMKALDKDRKRRYDSASRLGEDLRNYIDGGSVNARPPTFAYRLNKSWKRNRSAYIMASVVLSSLLAVTATLWHSNLQLHVALSKWRHALLERGIEAALRGDEKYTLEIAAEAKDAIAPDEWVQLILGVAKMNAGKTPEAVELLSKAHARAPDNLSIACALVMCSIGNKGAFVKTPVLRAGDVPPSNLMASLWKIPPSEEFPEIDKLFRGWTQVYEDPTKAVKTLQSIVDQERPWAVSQAMLAMALVHEAADTGDGTLALNALAAIQLCEDELGDSPFVMFVPLHCRCVALLFAADLLTPVERAIAFGEARDLAERMDKHPKSWAADLRAGFYELANDVKTESVYKRTRNDWWCVNRAAVMLRLDPDWIPGQIGPNVASTPLQAVGDASALALLDDHDDEARQMYEKLRASDAWPVRLGSLELLLHLDDSDECQRRSRELLTELRRQKEFFDPPFWHFRKRLEYLSGETGFDSSAFITSMAGSKFGECNANYLIALKLRCDGNHDAAKQYFEACVATKQFWMWPYHFSKSILQRDYDIRFPPLISP